MDQPKIDPRVLRTRKLIMDAFIKLSETKEFSDITVKNITEEAMINRATFYYHFQDIYDLLEKVLSEVLLVNLNYEAYKDRELDEETLIQIFSTITEFQKSLSTRCYRGYEDTIARIIRDQLKVILHKMLLRKADSKETETLKITAAILGWGIYGASIEWRKSGVNASPEEFIRPSIPYILSGITFRTEI